MKIGEHHRLLTYNIKVLYVNIPIQETLKITEQLLRKENNTNTTQQIITILETLLKQNYFEFQNNIYKPDKGVSMGSPISGIVAEIFLQHLENTHIKHLLDTKNITYYTRYVYDMLIIYDTKQTDDQKIHDYNNSIHNSISLNPTLETNNQINFLDLQIIRKTNKLGIDIHRKPTTTNTTINYTSNHPAEHRLAAYRYHITRMLSVPLTPARQQNEWNTI
jgi:hypothetical protein